MSISNPIKFDPNAVKSPDHRVLSILLGLAGKYGKNHCWPSQQKILDLMRHNLGRYMSRRTLCRHLRAFARDGHIARIPRHKNDGRGRMVMRSTLYVIRRRAMVWLVRLRHASAQFMEHRYIKDWLAGNPARAARGYTAAGAG